MPAIITSQFRINNARNLLSKVSTGSVYVGVGKSDDWPVSDTAVVTPSDSLKTIREASMNISALKRVQSSGARFVIPRVDWAIAAFKEWDPSDETCFEAGLVGSVNCLPCYCVHNGRVYKCITNAKNASGAILTSSVPPSITDYGVEMVGPVGGYRWAYMFDLEVPSEFTTREFIAVPDGEFVDASVTAKRIYGYRVKSGGTGYTSDPTLTIVGDGTGAATGTITRSGNAIVDVKVGDALSQASYGSNYNHARIVVGGPGSGAVIEPLLSPENGHGFNPVEELNAVFGGFAVNLAGDESQDLSTTNDFRQITLVVDPLDQNDDPIVPDAEGYVSGSKSLTYTSLVGTPIQPDSILGQVGSNAKAFVDHVDTVSGTIYYHQNYSPLVNFTPFTDSDPQLYIYPPGSTVANVIAAPGASASATVDSVIDSEYKHGTGKLLFLENRRKVSRASSQTEEIKLIVQF